MGNHQIISSAPSELEGPFKLSLTRNPPVFLLLLVRQVSQDLFLTTWNEDRSSWALSGCDDITFSRAWNTKQCRPEPSLWRPQARVYCSRELDAVSRPEHLLRRLGPWRRRNCLSITRSASFASIAALSTRTVSSRLIRYRKLPK